MWLVKEICTAEANDLGRLWNSRGTRVAAPYLMPVEVTNALHQRAARGEPDPGGGDTAHGQPAVIRSRTASAAASLQQGLGAGRPTQTGRGLRRPLLGFSRDSGLRAVDRRREILPGCQSGRSECPLDRRAGRPRLVQVPVGTQGFSISRRCAPQDYSRKTTDSHTRQAREPGNPKAPAISAPPRRTAMPVSLPADGITFEMWPGIL